MKKFLSAPRILKNERGMAIIMVVGVVTILTFLLADFTFDTKLNKIKIYNYQDKLQARLNAESGLNFALSKLKLYQNARNLLEKNTSAQSVLDLSKLESIVTNPPFIIPITLPSNSNLIQKSALEDFTKNNILPGQLSVFISPVRGFLNPNNMRIPKKEKKKNDLGNQEASKEEEAAQKSNIIRDADGNEVPAHAYIENKLIEDLEKAIERKKEHDEDFDATYPNIEAKYLIKELKYYVSHKNSFEDDLKDDIVRAFADKNIIPKHGPLTSIYELYTLPSWDDQIVDLIKDRISVHEAAIIQVNEITSNQLKTLFPNITPEQLEEFFNYRDGNNELKMKPHKFKNEEDFKNVIVGTLGVVGEESYRDRIKEFEAAGLKIGVASKLYKVTSVGKINRSEYRIVAFIDLPIKPPKKVKKKAKQSNADKESDKKENETDKAKEEPSTNDDKKKKTKIELMEPRVIEVRLE